MTHAEVHPAAPGVARSEGWDDADRLFRSDPRWRGSDDAYSVALDDERTLWLFGDTFVAERPGTVRADAHFVRNTVGIQTGSDPSSAEIAFTWGRAANGDPDSFFLDPDPDVWLWPLDGVRLGDGLLLFFMRTRSPQPGAGGIDDWRDLGALGFFEVFDWGAIAVENPDDDPADWRMRTVERAPNPSGLAMGAALVVEDGWLNAYGWRDGKGYLCRWSLDAATAGDLRAPEWWDGAAWVDEDARAAVVIPESRTELTIHRDPASGLLCHVQMEGITEAHLAVRWAEHLTGPWSDPVPLFEPPESGRPGVMLYAGKAHPQLRGADLVCTYASNGEVEATLADESIYYPRFARVSLERRP